MCFTTTVPHCSPPPPPQVSFLPFFLLLTAANSCSSFAGLTLPLIVLYSWINFSFLFITERICEITKRFEWRCTRQIASMENEDKECKTTINLNFACFEVKKINHANLLNLRFYGIILFQSLESREKYMKIHATFPLLYDYRAALVVAINIRVLKLS